MSKVRHVLGISGGKDSSALAIYLKDNYPNIPIEYYFCDTGKELKETIDYIDTLRGKIGHIELLRAAKDNPSLDAFDHFIEVYRGYLPSSTSRWCTKKLKLEPFEEFVGDDPVISYVAIRGDEDREGYISKKSNIQSIFPFRKNIWSEDIIKKILNHNNIPELEDLYKRFFNRDRLPIVIDYLNKPISEKFTLKQKLNVLLDLSISSFNKVVFEFLKTTDYPVGQLDNFPLIEDENILELNDIIKLLENSDIGLPKYYDKKIFEINGITGEYSRSRSGCFFCFFQQKIEWIWLKEQHKDLFDKAKIYEKDGYTWNEGETLEELSKPDRIREIKLEYLKRREQNEKNLKSKSKYLVDIITNAEGEGCTSCFI